MMFGRCFHLPAVLLLIVVAVSGALPQADAQSLRPLREARSDNPRFVLRVDSEHAEKSTRRAGEATSKPASADATREDAGSDAKPTKADGPDASDDPRSTEAERESKSHDKAAEAEAEKTGDNTSDAKERSSAASKEPTQDGVAASLFNADRREIWTAKLVNEVAPLQAVIADDGSFTVTFDDYPVAGARHAVVIYDERGQLLREFDIHQLLRGADWREVKAREEAVVWLRGAKIRFSDDNSELRINLRWGRKLVINLRTFELTRDGVAADKNAAGEIEPEVPTSEMELSSSSGEATTVARPFTDEEMHDAMRRLSELLANGGDANEISELAAKVQAMLQQLPLVSEEDAKKLLADAEANGIALEVDGMAENAAAILKSSPEMDGPPSPELLPAAGNSSTTRVPVPQPDPARRVNYLEWYREQSRVDGPSAEPIYREMMDQVKQYDGDPELQTRALRGDPEALASPEIQAWLSANAGAVDLAWKAIDLPYKGFEPKSDDGSLIGVLLPQLGRMREVTKVAVARGHLMENADNPDAAREEYMKALRLGNSAGQGGTLIENLVGQAIQRTASEALLDSLDKYPKTDYLALASKLEESYQPARPLEDALQFERAMAMDMMQTGFEFDADAGAYRVSESGLSRFQEALSIAGDSSAGRPEGLALGLMLGGIGFERLVDDSNSMYDRMTEAARKPFAEGQADYASLEREMEQTRLRNPILGAVAPALSRAHQNSTTSAAQRNATLLVANLRAYQQQNGSLPPSLDVFGDKPWTRDPLTGQPFRYEPGSVDFMLYSVGIDGADQGGTHDPKGRTNDTVYWPRPPKE